jgi:hypothetical protein
MRPSVLAAALSSVVLVACTANSDRPPAAPTGSSATIGTTTTADVRTVSQAGVTVAVPADSYLTHLPCGRWSTDLVVRANEYSRWLQCRAVPTRRDIVVVWLGSAHGLMHSHLLGEAQVRSKRDLHRTHVAGYPALVGSPRSVNGGRDRLVVFPTRHVFVSVRAADPTKVQSVFDSIRLAAVSGSTGCRWQETRYDGATWARPHEGRAEVRSDPIALTACAYSGDVLQGHADLGSTPAHQLADAMNHAPPPTQRHVKSEWPGCVYVDHTFHVPTRFILLRFGYRDGAVESVVARWTDCTRWQSYVSNGTKVRRIDPAVVRALPAIGWNSYRQPDLYRIPSPH